MRLWHYLCPAQQFLRQTVAIHVSDKIKRQIIVEHIYILKNNIDKFTSSSILLDTNGQNYMRNIFIFLMCIFMHNITFANCADLEELRETVFQKSREVVKSNGKYVGFILEENSKIICFDLVKLHNGETETSAYSLDSHICIDLKNTDNKLEGFIKVAYLDNVHTISTDIEINDDFHIIGAKTATQTHKNITKVQKLAIFYINISDLKNPNPVEASDNASKYKLLENFNNNAVIFSELASNTIDYKPSVQLAINDKSQTRQEYIENILYNERVLQHWARKISGKYSGHYLVLISSENKSPILVNIAKFQPKTMIQFPDGNMEIATDKNRERYDFKIKIKAGRFEQIEHKNSYNLTSNATYISSYKIGNKPYWLYSLIVDDNADKNADSAINLTQKIK